MLMHINFVGLMRIFNSIFSIYCIEYVCKFCKDASSKVPHYYDLSLHCDFQSNLILYQICFSKMYTNGRIMALQVHFFPSVLSSYVVYPMAQCHLLCGITAIAIIT